MIFQEITHDILEKFRLIYHQTINYSNPIIESVLYDKTSCGTVYFWGDILDGNFMIFHRSGFSHLNFNQFQDFNFQTCKSIDDFIVNNERIPEYLMFYSAPAIITDYWKAVEKPYFKSRKRKRYQLDENNFKKLNKTLYQIPDDHQLITLDSNLEYINAFGEEIWNKFYNSKSEFLEKSFGFVLINEESRPVAISYLLSQEGKNGECSLITLPEFRKKGYGFIIITNYIAESIKRKINVGWDCFIDNYTNEWVKLYGYTNVIREYDFITFSKRGK